METNIADVISGLEKRIASNRELIAACEAALELLRDPDADAIAADKVEAMLDGVIAKAKGQA